MPKLQFPKGVIVNVHPNGWFDDNITKDWLKRVWGRRPGARKDRSMLVLDAFRCHRSPVVKSVLNADKTDLAIIPGGMTSATPGCKCKQTYESGTAAEMERLDVW